jgi:hypothetical protein
MIVLQSRLKDDRPLPGSVPAAGRVGECADALTRTASRGAKLAAAGDWTDALRTLAEVESLADAMLRATVEGARQAG